ncbi:hypothetical protein [Pseudonocardia yunnanensis]|uniref:Uncharacterized protein n=1 Tax=Pseudonocardia yunnanensis TaxID=58107 RepID=A0ABW4EXS0_9PSEU
MEGSFSHHACLLVLTVLSTVLAPALVACGSDRGGSEETATGPAQPRTVVHARGETQVLADRSG